MAYRSRDNFAFGAAKALYDRRVHPRVMFDRASLDALREACRRGLAATVMRTLRADIDLLLADAQREGTRSLVVNWSDWYCRTARMITQLDDVAFVAVIDQRDDLVQLVADVLAALPEADEAGNRAIWHCGALLRAPMAYDLIHDQLDAKARRAFVRWAAQRLVRNRLKRRAKEFYLRAGMNVVVSDTTTAIVTMLTLQGDDGAPDFGDTFTKAARAFEAHLYASFGPDGYPEEDIGYGTAFMGTHLAPTAEALRRAGVYDAYAACPRYVKVGQAVLHFVQPRCEYLTNTGDNSDIFLNRALPLGRLADETGDRSLAWLARTLGDHYSSQVSEAPVGDGASLPAECWTLAVIDALRSPARPKAPRTPTAFRDRRRGIVSFRSGWDDDATYLVFDGSQRCPAGQGHFHASAGHFDLTALGEYFAIDTGRYNMEQDQHNVTLINGTSGRSVDGRWESVHHAGRLIAYAPSDHVDYAAFDSSHQHACTWARRHAGLVKMPGETPYVWLADDISQPDADATLHWSLNTSPTNSVRVSKTRATIQGGRFGNLLDVHVVAPWARGSSGPSPPEYVADEKQYGAWRYLGEPDKVRELLSPTPHFMVHRSALFRPRLTARLPGTCGRFLSLMLPRRKRDAPANVRSLTTLPDAVAIRITFRQHHDTLIFAFDHRLLEADGVSARGQWCVVRRSRTTGRVIGKAVHDGAFLGIGAAAV